MNESAQKDLDLEKHYSCDVLTRQSKLAKAIKSIECFLSLECFRNSMKAALFAFIRKLKMKKRFLSLAPLSENIEACHIDEMPIR